VDVEKPASVSSIIYSSFSSTCSWKDNNNKKTCCVEFHIPIHARYQAPSSSEYNYILLHAPFDISIIPSASSTISYEQFFNTSTANEPQAIHLKGEYFSLLNTWGICSIRIPTGQLWHTNYVKIITIGMTVCGAILVGFITLHTSKQSISTKQKKD